MARFDRDPDVDAAYLSLTLVGRVASTRPFLGTVLLDHDPDGELMGIELLGPLDAEDGSLIETVAQAIRPDLWADDTPLTGIQVRELRRAARVAARRVLAALAEAARA